MIFNSDAIKTARISRTFEDTSALSRALEAGVETGNQAASLGREVDALLDSDTLATRGHLGEKFDKNNERLLGVFFLLYYSKYAD